MVITSQTTESGGGFPVAQSQMHGHVGCRPPKATLLYVSCEEKLEKRKEKKWKKERGNALIGSMTLCEFVCLL